MTSRNIGIATALLLLLSGGAALAQFDDPQAGFFANPVLPSPSPIPAHIFHASQATTDAAMATPAAVAARRQHEAGCSALNPCAMATPAARG